MNKPGRVTPNARESDAMSDMLALLTLQSLPAPAQAMLLLSFASAIQYIPEDQRDEAAVCLQAVIESHPYADDLRKNCETFKNG